MAGNGDGEMEVSTSARLDSEDPLSAQREGPTSSSSPQPQAPSPRSLRPDIEIEEVDAEEFAFLDTATHLATLQTELDDVRTMLAETRNNGQYIPLKLFRARKHNSINVTDIVTGLWCEVQLEYKHLHPHMKKTREWSKMEEKGAPVMLKTPVMKQGAEIHLKKELEVHEKVVVKMVTNEDRWAVQLITTYLQLASIKVGGVGIEREIAVFGDPFTTGILITGIIDQLQYSPESNELTLLDYKTRRSNSLPGAAQKKGNALQLMLYKSMLDHLICGRVQANLLSQHLKLDFSVTLSTGPVEHIKQCGLMSLFTSEQAQLTFGQVAESTIRLIAGLDLPLVSSLLVQYEYQVTGEVIGVNSVAYNELWMKTEVENALRFWLGEKPAKGVDIEDTWKCDVCQFRDICVWRMQQKLACSPAAKLKPHNT